MKITSFRILAIVLISIVSFLYVLPTLYSKNPVLQVTANTESINQLMELNNIVPIKINNNQLTFENDKSLFNAKNIFDKYYKTSFFYNSTAPNWLKSINSYPMVLGLDLRGGVQFLLALNMDEAVEKLLDKYVKNIKILLQQNNIQYIDVENKDHNIVVLLQDKDIKAEKLLKENFSNLAFSSDAGKITLKISDDEITQLKLASIKQNISTLYNRVNGLGIAEPIIQQRGNYISVELAGLHDTERAKEILGSTATLEMHLVSDEINSNSESLSYNSSPIYINKNIELNGENIVDATTGFDENNSPAVNIKLNSVGAKEFKKITGVNIGRRLAMVLVNRDNKEVITAPVIRGEIGGGQVQISGSMNIAEANNIALLLKSGSLAISMKIVSEETVGPSLGASNIQKSINAVLIGFVVIGLFITVYYRVFGAISVLSLGINALMLLAIIAALQITLTLSAIAALALTLGMAIDSNILINERIREELLVCKKSSVAIIEGYKHAWKTILDSNISNLLVGLSLLTFSSGPVKGFAIVHCLGIITSLFSAVFVSKSIVLFSKLKKIYI